MGHLKLAVFLSGSGTTLENLLERCADGSLDASVVVVVSSRADAFGLERARRRGIPAVTVARKGQPSVEAFSEKLFAAVEPYGVDLVCTAGFMCLLRVPPTYEGRIVNVHPALLPAFGGKGYYGQHVHEAVLAHGCKVSGCTVHFLDNVYDNGPIIAQQTVPVLEGDTADTLAARVQAAERELFPQAIQLFADKRINVVNRVVRVLPPQS